MLQERWFTNPGDGRGGKEEKNNNKPLVTVHEEGGEERIKVGNTVSVQSWPQGVAISVEKRKSCVTKPLYGWREWNKMYGCTQIVIVIVSVIV